MRRFSDLNIKLKLIAGFILVATFTAIVGAIGIVDMSKINDRTKSMYETNFIPSVGLNKVQQNLLLIRSNFLLMTYEKDVTKFQSRCDEIEKWTNEDNKLLAEYEKNIETSEEKDTYAQLNSNLVPYRQLRTEIIKLLQEGKYVEAQTKVPEFSSAREKVDSEIDKLITLNEKYASDTNSVNSIEFKSQTVVMISIVILGVALAILLGIRIASIISKPLDVLVVAAHKIAGGDLNVDVDINTNDEVGILAKAFKKMSDNINELIINIDNASVEVAAGAKQVASSSVELSQGATEQASSIEELTASIEEISSQTNLNSDNANEANKFAEIAKQNAIIGNKQMEEMLRSMEEINESSSSISKIIKVIDEIAFQTNILALNAAVEAARAGQHGKGFAVVAEEVRNLAARSAKAAKETTDMIESSIRKVNDGTKIANETAKALNEIVEGVAKVSNIVSDIAIASQEQASAISQINLGIMGVSEVVQENSATSEESASASEELSSQAVLLRDQVARFKTKEKSI